MCCLDIVRVVIPPRSSHSFRILVVRGHVVVIREVLVADSANPALLHNLSVQKFPHLGRGSQFPISARVMRIFNSLNSKSDYLRPGKKLPPTAGNRLMDRAQFIATESHGTSPGVLGLACGGVQREVAERRKEERSSSSCVSIPGQLGCFETSSVAR